MKGIKGNDAVILPVSISTKPMLTEEHKSQRVFYCCSNVNADEGTYHDCYNLVHINEKCFYIREAAKKFFPPCENLPNQLIQLTPFFADDVQWQGQGVIKIMRATLMVK